MVVVPKKNKYYFSDAATHYKLLELQPVICQMFKDAVKENFAFIFKLKHPNLGRKTLPGCLCLKMKNFFKYFERSVALYRST